MTKGRLQYFFHSKLSTLPVRDVTNSQKKGHKTEPHLEIGAENYIYSCMQPNIKGFCLSDEDYLFLFTTCKNRKCVDKKGNNLYNKRLIVGYIKKERYENFNDFYLVYGDSHIVSFENSVDTEDDLAFSRTVRQKKLDASQTKLVLDRLLTAPNILDDVIKEIIRLDPNNNTCRSSHGLICPNEKICRRKKLLNQINKQ